MLKRLLAIAVLGSLAGCVVGPGPGNGYYSQGYYDPGYGQSGYYDQGYAPQPAYPTYPAYGAAPVYGVVDIAVGGGRRDSRYGPPPRPDGRWQHDDGHGRPAPQGGYGGAPRAQANQPQPANSGRDPNWRGSNGGGWGGGNTHARQDNDGGGRGNRGSNRQGDGH